MFHLRRTFRVRAWRAGHLYRSQSFQQVGVPQVQEQTDCRRLSGRPVWFLQVLLRPETEMETAFAPGFWLQDTSTTEGKLRTDGKPWCVLDSSFLLVGFLCAAQRRRSIGYYFSFLRFFP